MARTVTFRTATPLAVWASIATYIAAVLWIDFFEPAKASFTVDGNQSWSGILIGAAAIAGTVLGVRSLWGLYVLFVAVLALFSLVSLVQDGVETQLVGGLILSVTASVSIMLPSAVRFETKRLSLLVEDPDDPRNTRPIPWGVSGAVALIAVLSFMTAGD